MDAAIELYLSSVRWGWFAAPILFMGFGEIDHGTNAATPRGLEALPDPLRNPLGPG